MYTTIKLFTYIYIQTKINPHHQELQWTIYDILETRVSSNISPGQLKHKIQLAEDEMNISLETKNTREWSSLGESRDSDRINSLSGNLTCFPQRHEKRQDHPAHSLCSSLIHKDVFCQTHWEFTPCHIETVLIEVDFCFLPVVGPLGNHFPQENLTWECYLKKPWHMWASWKYTCVSSWQSSV